MKNFYLPLKEHKILLVGLFLGLILFFGGKAFMKPITTKIDSSKAELDKLTTEKNNLFKEVDLLKSKEEEARQKEQRLIDYFMLKSKLANLTNPSKFFKDITDFKKIRFNNIRPIKKEKISHYIKMELNLNISGSYEDVYDYLKYLDNLPYIISIKKLDFSKGDSKNNNINMVIETVGR